MGNIDPNMTGTPDPQDMGDAVVPETNGNPDETTVFQPVGLVEDAADSDEGVKKPCPKWLVPAIAAGVAVIVLGASAGGYAYALNNVNAGMNAASAWNAETVKTLQESVKDAQALLEETGEDQVADPQVLEELKKAVGKAQAVKGAGVAPNGLLVWELLDAEKGYDESTNTILDLDASLDKAVKEVEKSVTDKTLSDAKDALSKAIDSAKKTLDGSDGKVQDKATRDALSKAIDSAKKALDGSDVEAIDTAKSDLESKVKTVNDSVKAKEQADAAAWAQTQQWYAPTYTPNYQYTPPTTPNYNNTNNFGNSGGQQTTTTTPNAPTDSADSGDMSFDWVEGDSNFNDNPWY